MITLNDVRHNGRGFEAAVVLPTHTGPLLFDRRVDGPASLAPSFIKRALLGHAVRRHIR